MKPVIGLLPLWDEKKDSLWMLPGYMDIVREAGGLPVMLPLTTDDEEIKQPAMMYDGFLFTGGHDVDPELYRFARKTPFDIYFAVTANCFLVYVDCEI